jgi:hypothetical protein
LQVTFSVRFNRLRRESGRASRTGSGFVVCG